MFDYMMISCILYNTVDNSIIEYGQNVPEEKLPIKRGRISLST